MESCEAVKVTSGHLGADSAIKYLRVSLRWRSTESHYPSIDRTVFFPFGIGYKFVYPAPLFSM